MKIYYAWAGHSPHLDEEMAATARLEVGHPIESEGVQVQRTRVDTDEAREKPGEVLHVSGRQMIQCY